MSLPLPDQPLASEEVIIEAPMSFTGATKRVWRRSRSWPPVAKWTVLPLVLYITWVVIFWWYVIWGIFLLPFRLIRRSDRNRRRQNLQHREVLAELEATRIQQHREVLAELEAMKSQQQAPPSAPVAPQQSLSPPVSDIETPGASPLA